MTQASPRWLLLILLAACAHSAPQETKRFPSSTELRQLAQKQPPKQLFSDQTQDTDTWQLTGPLPDAVDTIEHPPASPWEQLLQQEVQHRRGRSLAVESMYCVAREIGLFYAQRQAFPSPRLELFMTSRCGAALGHVSTSYLTGEVPAQASDETIYQRWQPQVRDLVARHFEHGERLIGIWYGRLAGKAIVLVASGERYLTLERLPLVPPPDGKVVLRGELLAPADRIQGHATLGRFGFTHCELDPEVPLPRFAMTCELQPQDPWARIEISYFPPRRVLGYVALSVMVWPATPPAPDYTRPSFSLATSASGGTAEETFLQMVNQVRGQASLPPITLAPAQSKTAAAVAPHYFGALSKGKPDVAELVALGMMAGWEVEGQLREGRFIAPAVRNTTDIAQLLLHAVETPTGREVLLDPTARQLAMGPVVSAEHQALGALLSSYSFFDEGQGHGQDVQAFLERLGRLRAAKNLPPPVPVSGVSEHLTAATQRLQRGKAPPRTVLNELLGRVSWTLQRPVKGWFLEANSVEQMQIPPEFLRGGPLHLAIAAGHYRPAGEPWWRLVFVVVNAGAEPGVTASREAPPTATVADGAH
ncbi:MAG TPA: hypothetical protein VH877_26660 [Polyangia bacterium]|jgi:hypothetical protein|nr:hypothetical protein [Polyangia bacterium]